MDRKNRWNIAQDCEKSFWDKQSVYIKEKSNYSLDWYRWKAEHIIIPAFKNYFDNSNLNDLCLLEIGPGPIGINNFLPIKKCFCIDPLEGFYKTRPELVKLRNGVVSYIEGMAEELPFDNSFFNFIIIDNVLDHVSDPNKVISEINRTLKKDGYIYLTSNIFSNLGIKVRNFYERFTLDKAHPHSFSYKRINKLMSKFFELIKEECEPTKSQVKRWLLSANVTEIIMFFIAIHGKKYQAFWKKS